jgi:uncharacterized protein (DUF736 family)
MKTATAGILAHLKRKSITPLEALNKFGCFRLAAIIYNRPNSGSLFKNDRKESENHPDYKGTALINGVEMWMSAWLKTSGSGTKFMSFSFQPKEQQAQPAARQAAKPAPVAEFDDLEDLPF